MIIGCREVIHVRSSLGYEGTHTQKREGTHKEATGAASGEQRVEVLLEVKKDKL